MKKLRVALPFLAIGLSLFLGHSDTALAQTSPLSVSPNPLAFTAMTGNAAGQLLLSVNSSAAPTAFTVSPTSAAGYFTVSPTSGLVPATGSASLTVTINGPAVNKLLTGMYTDAITLTTGNGATFTAPITLNLTANGTGGSSTLTASPGSLTFNLGTGTQFMSQQITISSSGAATSVTASTTVPGITISPTAAVSTPATFLVTANSSGLANTTYSGTINFTPATGTALAVPVTLTVGTVTTGTLTVTPNPLSVTVPVGSTTPINQLLTVSTSSASIAFTTTASTGTGQNWLTVNPFSQIVTSAAPVGETVSISPSGLSVGSYTGTITLTPQNGTPTSVPVNLTISGAPAFTVSPPSMMFSYQTGTAFPLAQPLMVGSTGQSIAFGLVATTQSGGSWLVVNPQGSTTPVNLSVSINPSGLSAGTYTGNIQLTAPGSATNSPLNVPVTLLVSNQPIIAFSNSGTMFNYQLSSASFPPSQTVQVTSSGNPLPFTVTTSPVTGGNFLTVNPGSGNTPQPLTIALNQAIVSLLAPGTYTENVTVNAPTAGNNPQSYPVTLVVTQNTLLNVSQSSLNFNYELNQTQPATQNLIITSSGGPLNYTTSVNTTTCGSSWLSAAPSTGTTNGVLAVSVNTTGLTAGTCMGTISITSPGAGNTLNIPVTLYVSSAALLNVSPSAINIQSQVGTNPANITLALTSTDPSTQLPLTVTSTTNNGGVNWLGVFLASGAMTPSNLAVGFNTAGLPVGVYTGSIMIASTGPANAPVVVPVMVTVTSSATISTTPGSLTFNQAFNGPVPQTQMLAVNTSTPGQTYAASATVLTPAGGNWLSVSPSGGITPGAVTVTANGAGLAQGTYSGVVTIVVPGAANTPFNVQVILVVGPAQSLTLSANSVTFNYQQGATTPPTAQTVQLTSSGGNVAFTATPSLTNGLSLFTVSPASGTTPAALSIGVNQSALASVVPGQPYTGTITISSPSLPGGNQTINVSLNVTAAAPPSIGTVVNSASNQPGAVAPGEIITIYGTNIGPTPAVGLQLTATGLVATTLGNTQVTFDGFAAPLIYVSATQINAIVPYEIAGRATVGLLVQRSGQTSMAVQLQVVNTSPGIFTSSQGGSGQGAILNQDQSVNSASNPAAKGSVIVIYATGEGRPSPIPATGSVTGTTPPFPTIANVSVTVGGVPAQILYAGEAPGLVSGALQVNALVPTSVGSGPQTVTLSIGGTSNTQQNVTVAVQ